MSRVAEILDLLNRDLTASEIANKYSSWNGQRQGWLDEKRELRNYIFATDTRKTTNSQLPWKNSTTIPKLCQIRDNLHANYMSALFPNDDWLKWEAGDQESDTLQKRRAIQGYMNHKIRESGFRGVISDLLYDYIDYGNAFAEVIFVVKRRVDEETGEEIDGYVGPELRRISPNDIVFNPLATCFEESPKITRCIKTLGELKVEAEERPEEQYKLDIIEQMERVRAELGQFNSSDVNKIDAFSVDGFGTLSEYYQSNYVEILEFEGDIHDREGRLHRNRNITVVDRSYIIRDVPSIRWQGASNKVHVAWRKRPDNLYGMGPLDNLVGMQYRIDHLENLKADAMDIAVAPPLGIKGTDVEDFQYGPFEHIYLGEDGDIVELGKNLAPIITADNQITLLEQKMEEMAGAPKQAMGIRTPGEKTAYEVQSLENAAGRIFQSKTTHFEVSFIEPAVNMMLEAGRRNLLFKDIARIMRDDIGIEQFMNVTKEDITAKGKLRPVGARHFAARAQLVQNLTGFYNSALGQDPHILSHMSGKKIAKLFEEVLGLDKYGIFGDNVRLFEAAETQRLQQTVQEDLAVEQQTGLEELGDIEEVPQGGQAQLP